MDEGGKSMTIPVEGGQQLSENYVGEHFGDFDGFLCFHILRDTPWQVLAGR